mgnify:CR=1 FL=1
MNLRTLSASNPILCPLDDGKLLPGKELSDAKSVVMWPTSCEPAAAEEGIAAEGVSVAGVAPIPALNCGARSRAFGAVLLIAG